MLQDEFSSAGGLSCTILSKLAIKPHSHCYDGEVHSSVDWGPGPCALGTMCCFWVRELDGVKYLKLSLLLASKPWKNW